MKKGYTHTKYIFPTPELPGSHFRTSCSSNLLPVSRILSERLCIYRSMLRHAYHLLTCRLVSFPFLPWPLQLLLLKTCCDKTDDTFVLWKENLVTQTQIVPHTFHPHYQVILPRSSGDILIYY